MSASKSQRRCKNCGEFIVHDTFDWVHWDGYYLCQGDKGKEGKVAE